MDPCELQPVHPCRKVSSSSKGSACSVRAAAEPLALTDMLHMAPSLLQSLCPWTMAALSSTCKQLRCLVHEHVTSIHIIQHSGHGTQYQNTELQVLTNGNWPRLQHLNVKHRAAAITQLSKASWSSLTSLDLSRNCLGTDAMSQLVLGKWPALKCLNLDHNRLDTAAVALLNQANWPLEELKLSDNDFNSEALEMLTQGRWPKLANLTLRWNRLYADSMAVLANVQWPLQHLDLAYNQLDADAMAHLGRGRRPDLEALVGASSGATLAKSFGKFRERAWPQLVSLNLSHILLTGADIAGLSTAHWPNLSTVDLAGNCLDELSMTHLIEADWPELKHLDLSKNFLDLSKNFLDVYAVEVLSHNCWHKLECVLLWENVDVTQETVSFLSIEQQHIYKF